MLGRESEYKEKFTWTPKEKTSDGQGGYETVDGTPETIRGSLTGFQGDERTITDTEKGKVRKNFQTHKSNGVSRDDEITDPQGRVWTVILSDTRGRSNKCVVERDQNADNPIT